MMCVPDWFDQSQFTWLSPFHNVRSRSSDRANTEPPVLGAADGRAEDNRGVIGVRVEESSGFGTCPMWAI